jgi:hypothetical protein
MFGPLKPIVFLVARPGFAVEFRHGLISGAGYSTHIVNILHNGKLTQNVTKNISEHRCVYWCSAGQHSLGFV